VCFYVIFAHVGENKCASDRGEKHSSALPSSSNHTTRLPTSAPAHQASMSYFLLSTTPTQAILSPMSRRTLQTNFVAGLVAGENTHPVVGADGQRWLLTPRAERILATDTVARLAPVTEGRGCAAYVEFRDTDHFLVSVFRGDPRRPSIAHRHRTHHERLRHQGAEPSGPADLGGPTGGTVCVLGRGRAVPRAHIHYQAIGLGRGRLRRCWESTSLRRAQVQGTSERPSAAMSRL
jgi:hypothetical protein